MEKSSDLSGHLTGILQTYGRFWKTRFICQLFGLGDLS